ncbi:fibrinogen-like protein 1 [Mytilus trossulus]|uniref:fibrinogen-like protein 1 n=1 Tax=Mytilus trossulus TaxID=6551 RepID=UPI0030047950
MRAWMMFSGLMLLSILVNSINSERICFSCSGMRQDEKCQHAITCDKDEICFVQKYFTHGNETKYDVGCTFQELCQKDVTGHILGKRNEHAHIVCQKCCNDSNVCNYDLSCQNIITRNDNIHLISTNSNHKISIYMELPDGQSHKANYTTFNVSNEHSLYVLTVTGYSGDPGQNSIDYPNDSLGANGKPFTTKDRDNDKYNGNLAVILKSAWWYSSSYYSDLNIAYSGSSGTMYWSRWSSGISKSLMMIKRTY